MISLEIMSFPKYCVNALTSDSPPTGISVEVHKFEQLAVGADTILVAMLTLAASVPANILSQWLYEKLVKEKAQHTYINDQKVPF